MELADGVDLGEKDGSGMRVELTVYDDDDDWLATVEAAGPAAPIYWDDPAYASPVLNAALARAAAGLLAPLTERRCLLARALVGRSG